MNCLRTWDKVECEGYFADPMKHRSSSESLCYSTCEISTSQFASACEVVGASSPRLEAVLSS